MAAVLVEEGEGTVRALLGHSLVALIDGRNRQQDARARPNRPCDAIPRLLSETNNSGMKTRNTKE